MVVVNGLPKSGTHALLAAYDLNRRKRVGTEYAAHGHWPAGHVNSVKHRHLFIIRQPRNCVISMMRMENKPLTDAGIISGIEHFNGKPFAEYADRFLAHLDDPHTHIVRYESLMADSDCIKGVCAFVGIPYVEGTFEALPNEWTPTRNSVRTDWRSWWSPIIDEHWSKTGLRIERALGYGAA